MNSLEEPVRWIDSTQGKQALSKWSEYELPDYMWGGMLNWIEYGIDPGSFLSSLLSNNLYEAIKCADATNIHKIPDYIRWLYNYTPIQS